MTYRVKAVEGQEYQLDVLVAPYGGPLNGKDAQGEYFTPETKFHEDKWSTPPVVYYHGLDDQGRPSGTPVYLGRTLKRWADAAGQWVRVELDHATEQARTWAGKMLDAAKRGVARASSGSAAHLVRREADGRILEWPIVEVSIFETDSGKAPANSYAVVLPVMKAVYEQAGIDLPDDAEPEATPEAGEPAAVAARQAAKSEREPRGEHIMEEKDIKQLVADAMKAAREEEAAATKAATERQAEIDAAVKAEKAKWEADAAKANRLPGGGAPYVTKFNDQKYDNLSADDLAFMIGALDASEGRSKYADRETALKSLVCKMEEAEQKNSEPAHLGLKALASVAGKAIKANEVMQSTLASYGDDWVGVAYSQRLWEAIRQGTFVVNNIPSIEMPAGFESMTIPLESGDPTFYKVAQVATNANPSSTLGTPVSIVPSSQMGSAKQSISLAKMGARVLWSGEMEEDSLIPFVPQLRRQLERAGAEQMEHAIIDGDTDATLNTNINDIAGTPGGTELFLLVDGLRKLGLITNTANSRSAGVLTVEDYLETLKLMGVAGRNAADFNAVDFIVDPWTMWKTLELGEVKTKDVYSAPTLENGVLTSIWGHRVRVSHFMNYAGVLLGTVTTDAYKLKSQTADGKVDQDTEADNVAGSILAVRWDQWLMAYRRRMTMETTRIPHADATEIVALARWGLTYRDTEAAAISYGVTL